MESRSKQYDWFRGSSNNKKGKENFKQSFKTFWKFTKIFLYFSLFFFSMWGCVQMFTHKTGTKISSGITFAKNSESLSPQLKIFSIQNNGTDKFPSIYLKVKDDYEAINKDNGKQNISDIKSVLNKNGVDGPEEARFGGNYIVKIVDVNGQKTKNTNQDGILYLSSNTPLLYTTAKNTFNSTLNFIKPIDLTIYKQVLNEKTKKMEAKKHIIITLNNSNLNSFANNLDPQEKLAINFNIKLFEEIINSSIKGQETIFSKLTSFDPTTISSKEEAAIAINNHNYSIRNLIQILGGLKQDPTLKKTILEYSQTPFGFNSNSNWRPITNWADAWGPNGGMGPFYGLFVWPISWITNNIVDSMPIMSGWESLITIVLVVVVVSSLMFAINFKNTLQQTKMQELSAKKSIIDAKYAPYKGNKQMESRQRAEVSDLYKKEGISPLASLGGVFISMPFFLAMWRVIGSIDHIKGTTWIGINFSATSWREWFGNLNVWSGGWVYFPLILLTSSLQIFSMIYPKLLTKKRDGNRINVQQKEAMKKSNKTQNIMMIVFGFMGVIVSAGLQIYFIVRSLWRIAEISITHYVLVYNKKRKITHKIK